MKVAVKIALLLLMLSLLAGAFILPKFVQRAKPPTPEEDLAAAIAAMGEEQPQEDQAIADVETEKLRADKTYTKFFESLDSQEFEAATEELVRLSPDIDADTREKLTGEMELAVNNMERESLSTETPEIATASAETMLPEFEAGAEPEPEEEAKPNTAPASGAGPEAETTKVLAYMATVQAGSFEEAEAQLEELSKTADTPTITVLKAALASAKRNAKEAERSREMLVESQKMMAEMQEKSLEQMRESVQELSKATKVAQEAAAEANRLKTELAAKPAPAVAASPKEPEPKPEPPVKIPETVSVSFGFDSTYLTDESKGKLAGAVKSLESTEKLVVQLRGYTDAAGASDYNGILARARCEVVKDYFLEKDIADDRLTIVAFGETQAGSSGQSPEELRRVDVIFRKR